MCVSGTEVWMLEEALEWITWGCLSNIGVLGFLLKERDFVCLFVCKRYEETQNAGFKEINVTNTVLYFVLFCFVLLGVGVLQLVV